jgi:hypothetical protein
MLTKLAPSVQADIPVTITFRCAPASSPVTDLGAQIVVASKGLTDTAVAAPGGLATINIPAAKLVSGAGMVIVANFVDTGSGSIVLAQGGAALLEHATSEDTTYLSLVL